MDEDLKFQVYCLELLNFLLTKDIFLLVAPLFCTITVKAKAYDDLTILTRFFSLGSTNLVIDVKTMVGSSVFNLVSSNLHWEEPLIT